MKDYDYWAMKRVCTEGRTILAMMAHYNKLADKPLSRPTFTKMIKYHELIVEVVTKEREKVEKERANDSK